MTTEEEKMESFVTPSLLARYGRGFANFMRQMSKHLVSFISMIVVLIFILLGFIGPAIAPYEFDEVNRGENRAALRNNPPSDEFIMGTDSRGRDVFSRLLWGARDTIGLPAVATTFAVLFGTIVGLTAAYYGAWVDEILSRIIDSLLALPALVLALVMLTTVEPLLSATDFPVLAQFVNQFGSIAISLTLVIVLLYVPIVARVVRSATLSIRDSGYIEAARLRGESSIYIMFREILPSVLPALVVEASLRFSYAIFLVASLGFLGLGARPPTPEWGRMVLDARETANLAPWNMVFPVAAIAILTISINLMSDGLRRVLRDEDQRE
jgi:peptide/nickel transport system permease protein